MTLLENAFKCLMFVHLSTADHHKLLAMTFLSSVSSASYVVLAPLQASNLHALYFLPLSRESHQTVSVHYVFLSSHPSHCNGIINLQIFCHQIIVP